MSNWIFILVPLGGIVFAVWLGHRAAKNEGRMEVKRDDAEKAAEQYKAERDAFAAPARDKPAIIARMRSKNNHN